MPAHRQSLILLFAISFLLAACERMPAVDPQAESQAIRSIDSTAAQLVASKDLVGITNLYAEDAIFMPPNAPQAATPAEISSVWAGWLQANPTLVLEATKVEVSQAGDLAYSAGSYRVSMDGPTGARMEDEGKYVVAWKKVDGQWKIAADIFNSNLPLAPADTTAAPKS